MTMKIVHQEVQDDPEQRQRVAILGFGREGKSLLKFLHKSPIYKNSEIVICDRDTNLRMHANDTNIKFKLGKDYLKNLDRFDVVFRSPGIPYNLPEVQKAIKKGVKFSSATQLFFEELRRPTQTKRRLAQKNIKIIGITGTKGKGTTATLLYKILKSVCPERSQRIYLAGNIGKPALELIPRLSASSQRKSATAIVVLELSSFQLQDLKQSPEIAVVLETFPDHMDTHKNLQEYFTAKANIAKWQKKTDKIFYFNDNLRSKWIAQKSHGKKIPVQCRDIGCPDVKNFLGTSNMQKSIRIPGFHNVRNALMAAAVALSLGCPKNKIIKVVKNFRGNEHRLELVRVIKIANQSLIKFANIRESHSRMISEIKFYNDSASTNPQTTAAAVRAFKESKVLIAGGKDKGLNYFPLANALKNSNTKLVILFGENKHKIAKAILGRKYKVASSKYNVVLVKDLKSAVKLAYKTARKLIPQFSNSPIIIVFSPGAASFGMFKDYVDRGKKFKELVRKLTQ